MDKKVGFYGGKFLPLHNGHIYSILYSARECDELHVFLFYNTFEEKKKIEESILPKKLFTPQTRELALKAEFKNYSNIKIHSIDSEKCFNNTNEDENIRWDSESKEVIKIVGCEPNIVFSSEPEYEEFFKKSYPNAEIVVIDAKRELFDISATEIRKNGEMKCWDYLSKAYKVLAAKSIVLFGEAALKRKIITDLTKLYQTTCVEMYNANAEKLKNELLKARYNSNKLFFINADENNIKDFEEFYKEQDLCIFFENEKYSEILKNIKCKKISYLNTFEECIKIINKLLA